MSEIKDKFSVIMPVLNAKPHLRTSVDSVLAAIQAYENAALFILDNGSDDGSYEILMNEYGTRASVLQVRDVTVAALRNEGARRTDGEFLAFIDSDCRIGQDYFEMARTVLRSGADVTGSKCVLNDSPHWIEKTWYEIHAQTHDGEVSYINSGNLIVKRQAFVQVAGFDENMVSCEDCDLCERLRHAGFKIYQSQAVRAVHTAGDKSFVVFFKKHAWRSMGMFGMLKNTWMSKPLIITLAHLLLCIVAIANLYFAPTALLLRIVFCVFLVNLAPAGAILFVVWRAKSYRSLSAGVLLLYHTYFLARFYAMWKLFLGGRLRLPERNVIHIHTRDS